MTANAQRLIFTLLGEFTSRMGNGAYRLGRKLTCAEVWAARHRDACQRGKAAILNVITMNGES
jgi:hypothetical protein